MAKGQNPFQTTTIPPGSPLCDREEDLKTLLSRARSTSSTTIYSPRRYGKTTLVLHVQDLFNKEGHIPIYVDLNRVTGIDEISRRLAKAVYKTLQARSSLSSKLLKSVQRIFSGFRPIVRPSDTGGFEITIEATRESFSGIDALESVLEDLGQFIDSQNPRVNIALDEFQDITDLKDHRIEGVLRSHIQRLKASFFFIGSRRRILLDMFNNKSRPFYQSSFLHRVEPLPLAALSAYLVDRFSFAGIMCPAAVADLMASLSFGHPHYVQKMASLVFDRTDRTVSEDLVRESAQRLIQEHEPLFSAQIQGLTLIQLKLLEALAVEPTNSPFSTGFLGRIGMSLSALQHSIKVLTDQDLIEKNSQGTLAVTDPFFSLWLKSRVV
jgi:hypothetical protein